MAAGTPMMPFADKLGFYSKREMEVREVIIRGILSIQEGDNPRILQQKLETMLPVDTDGGGRAGDRHGPAPHHRGAGA